jgi:hypothetical protein
MARWTSTEMSMPLGASGADSASRRDASTSSIPFCSCSHDPTSSTEAKRPAMDVSGRSSAGDDERRITATRPPSERADHRSRTASRTLSARWSRSPTPRVVITNPGSTGRSAYASASAAALLPTRSRPWLPPDQGRPRSDRAMRCRPRAASSMWARRLGWIAMTAMATCAVDRRPSARPSGRGSPRRSTRLPDERGETTSAGITATSQGGHGSRQPAIRPHEGDRS